MNSTKNKVRVEADPSSALRIEADHPALLGLVGYSALGGGDIAVSIAKLKRCIHTQKSVKEYEISELKLQGSAEEIAKALKKLLS